MTMKSYRGVFLLVSIYISVSSTINNIEPRMNDLYPFRICSMDKATDLMRFDRNIVCAPYKSNAVTTEGILLVYKSNIVAYTFPVWTYKKELTFQNTYRDTSQTHFLDRNVVVIPMPLDEVHLTNTEGVCYTTATLAMNGKDLVAYHNNSYENTTMRMTALEFKTSVNKRYTSLQNEGFRSGPLWFYSVFTTINCIVTEATAKSKYPYHFFALTTGETVEGSPFFDGNNNKVFNEELSKFTVKQNYTMLTDFERGKDSEVRIVPSLAFLEKGDTMYAWEVIKEEDSMCLLKLWTVLNRTMRSDLDSAYHFIARELTASFVTPKDNITLTEKHYSCIEEEYKRLIDEIYKSEYNETHEKDGGIQIYRSTGDLILVWQPLVQKSLKALENASLSNQHNRRRRDTISSVEDVLYVQIQYMYDTLKSYINDAFGELATSWCLDQKRTIAILHELSKINPSAIASTVYGKPVSAKLVGDVLSVSKCMLVNQTSVQLHKDMRVLDASGKHVDNTCYTRPLLSFSFLNSSSTTHQGQLGMDNVILLGNHRTEECEETSTKVFVSGDIAHVYKNYLYTNTTPLSEIQTLDAFIGLNIEPLENTDFAILNLYSKEELRKANVHDLETMLREHNAYKSALYNIQSKLGKPTPEYIPELQALIKGLGLAGATLGAVAGVVVGAFANVVGGFLSFITNPFGGTLTILLIVGFVALVLVVYFKQRRVVTQPIDYLFPYAAKTMGANLNVVKKVTSRVGDVDGTRGGSAGEKYLIEDSSSDAMDSKSDREYSKEEALKILKAIKSLDDSYRKTEAKKAEKPKKPTLLDRLKYRDYQALDPEGQ